MNIKTLSEFFHFLGLEEHDFSVLLLRIDQTGSQFHYSLTSNKLKLGNSRYVVKIFESNCHL